MTTTALTDYRRNRAARLRQMAVHHRGQAAAYRRLAAEAVRLRDDAYTSSAQMIFEEERNRLVEAAGFFTQMADDFDARAAAAAAGLPDERERTP